MSNAWFLMCVQMIYGFEEAFNHLPKKYTVSAQHIHTEDDSQTFFKNEW